MYDAFKENGYNITLIYDDKISSLDSVECEGNEVTVNVSGLDEIVESEALNSFLIDLDADSLRPFSIVVTTSDGRAVKFIAFNKTVCTYLKIERYRDEFEKPHQLSVQVNITELGNDLTQIGIKQPTVEQ